MWNFDQQATAEQLRPVLGTNNKLKIEIKVMLQCRESLDLSLIFHDEIKKVILNYCTNLLTSNPPEEQYKSVVNEKENLHKLRMKENVSDDENGKLTREDFEHVLKKLNNKHAKLIINLLWELEMP